MIVNEEIVLKDCEVLEKCGQCSIAIYGAGRDGKSFWKHYHDKLNIAFFIDGKAKGEYNEKKIYAIEQVIEVIKKEHIRVVICSRLYFNEMKKKLEKNNLTAGEDFFIWDICYNLSVKQFISHNQNVWSSFKNVDTSNVVIFPMTSGHDGSSILYSYCANYLAKKYNAKLCAYVRRDGMPFDTYIYPSIVDTYASFNIENIIEIELTDEQENRAQSMYDEIIVNIHTLDDWNHIHVNNYNFGRSIIRDYLRVYPLSFEPLSEGFKLCLIYAIRKIVFWDDYFKENSVKCVVLWDGVHNESYLRDIAIRNGVNTYILHQTGMQKAEIDFDFGGCYPYIKDFYQRLSSEEKKIGIEWAKKRYSSIFDGGNAKDIPYRGEKFSSVFQYSQKDLILGEEGKVKVLICPHIFDEDACNYGWQLFENNYLSWLLFLGEFSEESDYEWYIKLHPDEKERGNNLICEFVHRYPKIKLLPADISPFDLKKAGIRYALTIAGSIGHEYPLLGIDVINAGNNPHISFDFNINPRTKKEYKEILMNLQNVSALSNKDEIYQFFCTYYLYYKPYDFVEEMNRIFRIKEWNKEQKEDDKSIVYYEMFLKLYSVDLHESIVNQIPDLFNKVDNYSEKVFYRKKKEGSI